MYKKPKMYEPPIYWNVLQVLILQYNSACVILYMLKRVMNYAVNIANGA